MLHTKGQLVANIKHWSTALSVVSKLSSAVVKQLLVNVVHYICTAIKEKTTYINKGINLINRDITPLNTYRSTG